MTGPSGQVSPPRLRPLWAVLLWVAAGTVAGLIPYYLKRESMGGEALAYAATGVLFGLVGGIVFALLYSAQSRRASVSQLQMALTGVAAAGAFVVFSAARVLLSSDHGAASFDLVLDGVQLVLGLLVGTATGLMFHRQR